MTGTDILTDALIYALDKTGGAVTPVAVVNATGQEPIDAVKISGNACNKLENTLAGVFSTLLVRATRQLAETLGLVALATAHVAPDGRIYVAQENIHGAGGLEKQLTRAFPNLTSVVKYKCRVLVLDAADAQQDIILRWVNDAAIRLIKHNRGQFWSAPGVFSWDRPDPASLMLLNVLPKAMPGNVADLGCGNGLLTGVLAKKEGVTELWALDADANAVESCKLNLDSRELSIPTHVLWRDVTADNSDLPEMDFVVTNPPFHTQQAEDRELGQKFCAAAMKMLRAGGELYLVANRHLPYEEILGKESTHVTLLSDIDGFKIIKATK